MNNNTNKSKTVLSSAALFAVAVIAMGYVWSMPASNDDIQSPDTVSSLIPSGRSQTAAISGAGSGLIAHYTFDDGTASDSSGAGHTGTVENGPTTITGRVGNAMKFDATDDRVVINDGSDFLPASGITVAMWANPSRYSLFEYYRLLVKYNGGPNGYAFQLQFNNATDAGQFVFYNHAESVYLPAVTLDGLNQWYHLVATADASGYKLYKNGTLVISDPTPWVPPTATNPTVIGDGNDVALDDLRIYDRALTSSEVSELYAYTGSGGGGGPTPVNGSCGPANNQCSAGTLSDTADTSTLYQWQCVGTNGGSTASCSATIPTTSDTTAPSISAISASSLTSSGATISWTTDESSDTQVEYGLTTSYGSNTTLNTSAVTTHSQTLTGLLANTLYNYRVKSRDSAGNLATSGNNTFTTAASGPTTYTLTVSKSGTGTGTVSGGSISCGSTCTQSGITSGTSITLTASASSGSTFAGWSGGGCSGTGTCTISVTADTSVSATFNTSASGGSTVTAATCSLSDVQAAINAVSVGGTVNIPAGTCTWGTGSERLSIGKAITVMGAGAGQTIINIPSNTTSSWTNAVIQISAAAVFGGLTINQPGTGNTSAISIGYSNNWRITGITYNSGAVVGYFVYADTFGLIDNCIINGDGNGSDEFIFTRGPADGWQNPSTMGTANAVYIEDCVFNGRGYTDFNAAAKAVVRFNTVNGSQKFDAHGKISNFNPRRSARHVEFYNNTWTSQGYWTAMELRGGTGMIFNNTGPTDPNGTWFILAEYYAMGNGYSAADYPIDDQIGVGMDPKVAASEPMYIWGNRRGSTIWTPSSDAYSTSMIGIINPDRDFYTEGSTFNGSSGVGRGTKSQMLAITPTKTNVGYWVTDEGSWRSGYSGTSGQLYVWNGSSWVLKYTPYTYPHPLRTGGSSGGGGGGPTPINGSCGTANNQCSAGTLSDTADTSTLYQWQCTGSNGGSTASCSAPIPTTSDTTAPTVPAALSATPVSTSQINLSWNASTDAVGVTGYRIYRGGTQIGTSPTASFSNTGLSAGTAYTYTVSAYDAAGNNSAQSASVSASTLSAADTTYPVISITAPTANATVSGSAVSISATATDNVGVVGVQWALDGSNLGSELTAAPYSGVWNTVSVSNGSHTLTATARDAAGNLRTATVSVTVSNTAPTYSLSISKSGSGSGTVTSSGGTVNCGSTCSVNWSAGSASTLTATPASGSTFLGWSGGSCSGTGTCAITLNANTTLTATFALAPDTTAPSVPTGITSSSLTQTGVTLSWLAAVDNVAVTGYRVYRDGTQIASPTTNSYAVTGLTANTLYTFTVSAYDAAGNSSAVSLPLSITTASVPVTTYTVSVSKSGSGTGTVTGNGINCGSVCSASVTTGTQVTLTASAASGSTFSGWGGACSGTGTCTTTVTAAASVSASFVAIPVTEPPASGGGGGGSAGGGSSTGGSSTGGSTGGTVSGPATGVFTPTVAQPAVATRPAGTTSTSCTTQTISGTAAYTRTLTLGSTGTDVQSLQKFLNAKGYRVTSSGPGSPGLESTYFGPATSAALARYQAANGIYPSTGLFNTVTMAKINALQPATAPRTIQVCPTTNTTKPVTAATATVTGTYSRDLTLGSTGTDVQSLQKFLNAKGYRVTSSGPGSPGLESTYFGPATSAALARYQAAQGIYPAAGYFGPKTRASVNAGR